MRTNICLAIMALFALVPFTGINAQYSLTVESLLQSALVVLFTGSTSTPMIPQTRCLRSLAMTMAHLVINTPSKFLTAP